MHVREEAARHLGQLDVLPELLDGQTGEWRPHHRFADFRLDGAGSYRGGHVPEATVEAEAGGAEPRPAGRP